MSDQQPTQDQTTLQLMKVVQDQRDEITRIKNRTAYNTSCSFSPSNGRSANDNLNLHTLQDPGQLIYLTGLLLGHRDHYNQAAALLGVTNPPPFKWQGYPAEDWIEDFKARLGKLQLSQKEEQLKRLESRLDQLVSPELRREMELARIKEELGITQ